MWLASPVVLFALAVWSGCGPSEKPAEKPGPKKPAEQAPAHEDHDHVHGPHDGEVIRLMRKDAREVEYHAEWLDDDDSGKLTVWILDKDHKDEVGIDAQRLSIDVITAAKSADSTYLDAANRTAGDSPTATRFEVVNQELLTNLANPKVNAMLRVTIKGADYMGRIEHHEHHH
jgi:hypothetical protein